MVLDYIPLSFDKVDEFFKDTGYEDRISQEEILIDLVDYKFCTYLHRYGKNAGLICGRKAKNIIKENCCTQHLKDLHPIFYKEYFKNNKSYYIKKDQNNIYYCNSPNIKNKNCKRKVKHKGELCYAHKHIMINFKKMILIFFIITILIFIIYIILILISNKKSLCFGSLNVQRRITYEKNICIYNKAIKTIKYNKFPNRKRILTQPLEFSNKLKLKFNNKYNFKIGEIEINSIKKINKKMILLKLKSLIFFKKLYLNIKSKNNIIVDEPIEFINYNNYNPNNINDDYFQTRRTHSYLFNDIDYIKKMYTSFDFLIKTFKHKYGPPPYDAERIINYMLNLLKNPDLILKIDNINDDVHQFKIIFKNK